MKISNDVNAQVFAALKVAELSKVPFLFISAPGVGKSTTVEIFADIRGYHYELLRGNSVSPEECLGYDTADTSKDATSTKHLRPEWFQRILDKEAEGKHTLLFLDELTTASPYVQSALLHLVFDRSVGNEKLPADTLVVSAGNYSQSLGNQFVLIPPLMNRFCIFNIIPGINDLKAFLSAYEGASTGKTILSIEDRLTPMLKEIDAQEDKTLSNTFINKVAEFIEKSVFETTRMLIQSEKSVDLSVTDMQNIYNDTSNADPMLRGFVTPRSLCYLVRLGVATYRCFGLDGIKSTNFRNMIEGLVGIGLSRTNKGEVQANIVTDRYADYIVKSVNDVEALNNSKVAEYADYFNTVLKPSKGKKTKKSFTHEEVIAVGNKILELTGDKSISSIERPVESALLLKVSTALRETQTEYLSKIDTGAGDPSVADLSKIDIEPSELAKIITQWNAAAVVESNILKLAKDTSRGYETGTISKIETDIEDFRRQNFRLKYLYKYAIKHAADDQKDAIKNLIPEPKME